MKNEKLIKEIIESIKKLSILELNELISLVEKEFNISANMANISLGAANANNSQNSQESEPSEVNLILKSVGNSRVAVIKAIKEITGLGLMDAKKLTEVIPSTIKEKISPSEAKSLGEKLTTVGAEIEIK